MIVLWIAESFQSLLKLAEPLQALLQLTGLFHALLTFAKNHCNCCHRMNEMSMVALSRRALQTSLHFLETEAEEAKSWRTLTR